MTLIYTAWQSTRCGKHNKTPDFRLTEITCRSAQTRQSTESTKHYTGFLQRLMQKRQQCSSRVLLMQHRWPVPPHLPSPRLLAASPAVQMLLGEVPQVRQLHMHHRVSSIYLFTSSATAWDQAQQMYPGLKSLSTLALTEYH